MEVNYRNWKEALNRAGFVRSGHTAIHLTCWEHFDRIVGHHRSLMDSDCPAEMAVVAMVPHSEPQDSRDWRAHVGIVVELDWYHGLERKCCAEVQSTIAELEAEAWWRHVDP